MRDSTKFKVFVLSMANPSLVPHLPNTDFQALFPTCAIYGNPHIQSTNRIDFFLVSRRLLILLSLK